MLTVRLFACQMQLERLLARQMEILQDAAVQERLQALDWRIPPAALKYLNDAQNGAANDASRENHGRNPLFCFLLDTSVPPGPRPGPSDCGSRPWMAVPGHFGPHFWSPVAALSSGLRITFVLFIDSPPPTSLLFPVSNSPNL